MTNYKKLKQIIQEANPNKVWKVFNGKTLETKDRYPIRLADVLLSMREEHRKQNKKNTIINRYKVAFMILKIINYWNLKDDNLDNQSQETKQFLIDILIKGN